MIAYTTVLLFIIGFFSSIKVGAKADRFLSYVSFASLFLVFCNFCDSFINGGEQVFSFMWNSSPSRDIKIDIISNPYNYGIVLPFFVITLLSVANNLLFNCQRRQSIYGVMLIFNLAILIMMITSNNFVQLLSAIFLIDILSVIIVRKIEDCKRYILINMCADMLLFMVLAVVNGFVDSLDIHQILQYKHVGLHEHFLTFAGLTAVFMKIGFVVFQVGILGLKDVSVGKLLNVLYLSAPITAIVLLLKFHIMWQNSEYFARYFDIMCITALIWSFAGCLIANNLNIKLIHWHMMFFALFIELLKYNGFLWSPLFTSLLLDMYLLSCAIYFLLYYYNPAKNVTDMISQQLNLHYKCNTVFWLLVVSIVLMSMTLTLMYNNGNRYYIWTFAGLFLLSLSCVFNQIMFAANKNKTENENNIPFPKLYFIELNAVAAILFYFFHINALSVWGITIVFVVLCCISPLQKLSFLYKITALQDSDVLVRIYRFAENMVRACGKFLWLVVDRFLMEKLIIGSVAFWGKANIRIFRRLHQSRWGGSLLVIVMLLLLLFISYQWENVDG